MKTNWNLIGGWFSGSVVPTVGGNMGPVPFSALVLPAGRNPLHCASEGSTATNSYRSFSTFAGFGAQIRNHPSVSNPSTLAFAGAQPLDLTVPKFKVRHHWSGGSIIKINDVFTHPADGVSCCRLPTSSCSPVSTPGRREHQLETSSWSIIHHVPVPPIPPLDGFKPSFPSGRQGNNSIIPQSYQPHLHVQIQIPLPPHVVHQHPYALSSSESSLESMDVDDDSPADVRASRHWFVKRSRKTLESCPAGGNRADASVTKGDLQLLRDSHIHLSQCRYYYGCLSWKEQIELLQNTKVCSLFNYQST